MGQDIEETCVLPLLADANRYVACPWDLSQDDEQRTYWLGMFRGHFKRLIEEVEAEYGDDPRLAQRVEAMTVHFAQRFDAVEKRGGGDGRLDIIALCRARESALDVGGIEDAYRGAKARENEAALPLLAGWLGELDVLNEAQRAPRLIEGIFAGNIFDLGATETLDLLDGQPVDFHATLAKLRPRPWLIDDLDAWLKRWADQPHRSAVLFVDNAGCDIVLGMIPFARELLRRGTDVLLAANSQPSLNDVTYEELAALTGRVSDQDPIIADALADGRLELVASGNDIPLIDLSRVSPALAQAVGRRGVDLVVLEGMGRAIESNLDAAFTCDVVKIAMLKDGSVAGKLDGRLYDLVFKFEPANQSE